MKGGRGYNYEIWSLHKKRVKDALHCECDRVINERTDRLEGQLPLSICPLMGLCEWRMGVLDRKTDTGL